MKLNSVVFVLALSSAALTQGQLLDVDSETQTNTMVEWSGKIIEVSKYSFTIESENTNHKIKVNSKTEFFLKCSTPRVNFLDQIVTVGEAGNEKGFRDYSFKLPIYVTCNFEHKNQFKRIMSSNPKRLNNFKVTNQPLPVEQGSNPLSISGEVKAGKSNRKLTLKDQSKEHEILLAKNGTWAGFNLQHLNNGPTDVRIRAIKTGEEVVATEILFWPTKREVPTDSDSESKTDQQS